MRNSASNSRGWAPRPRLSQLLFLRHVAKRSLIVGSTVRGEAFHCRPSDDGTLSFTLLAARLQAPGALEQYQRDVALPSRDLPALCQVSSENFAACALIPRLDDDVPGPYGDLHHVTDCPGADAAEALAALASQHAILLPFVKHR